MEPGSTMPERAIFASSAAIWRAWAWWTGATRTVPGWHRSRISAISADRSGRRSLTGWRAMTGSFAVRSCAAGNPQEDHERAVEAQDIRVVEHADLRAEPGPAHGGDLVHHDPAGSVQAVAGIWLDQQPEQRSVSRVGGERA